MGQSPHVQIYFTLKNDKGEAETWGVERASPENMLASGWTKNTFKAGDQISVSFVPAKGDRAFGISPRFVLPDAQVLGRSRCSLGGGGGVLVNTLPIKPGYNDGGSGDAERRRQEAPVRARAVRNLSFLDS